ncbi:hypothetical protein BHE74_00022243 [Ensete ventricosum]|uniref:Uncharacterized protein n=1 Tax=Ensete ventricosum TaxID=4639 RepID=A0A426ZWK3_ENSVE|nr:hypothetical protein B296_00013043 [Ensete ventricosum]RWW70096.1 hypothetical protein BHE74_00022243 [Ensete ventricosum]RZR91158.1 hypothetical protein BHM03_00019218 [Ensete ventricosum]
MDTVCLCRDPLLSTHLGWVKAFGFFIGRVKVVQPVVSGGDRVPVPRHTQQHVFEKVQLFPLYLSPRIFLI